MDDRKMLAIGSLLLLFGCAAAGANPTHKKPVLIFLFSRFYDHPYMPMNEDRIERLLPLLDELRARHPESGVSAVFQFSGAVAGQLEERNDKLGTLSKIRRAAELGYLEIGYDGEHEPTYRNRPKADLRGARTPHERWKSLAGAAERFLRDHKDPYTGEPDSKRAGGLLKVQQVLGEACLITGVDSKLGADTAAFYQVQRLNGGAITLGLPEPSPIRGIHGYGGSAAGFARMISPSPDTAPGVYWQDNILRTSHYFAPDVKVLSAEQGVEAVKANLDKLDRTHVQVVHLEIGNRLRYLNVWHDNVPRFDPLVWAYDHVDEPLMPSGVPAWRGRKETDEAYEAEEAVLNWLLTTYLPSNAGSRFAGCRTLLNAAITPLGSAVSKGVLAEAARDVLREFEITGLAPGNFVTAKGHYFSLADTFQLLAAALGALHDNGTLPESVALSRMYGPLDMTSDMGAAQGQVSTREVTKAAAALADLYAGSDAWTPIPVKTVPTWVEVGQTRVNAAQFLRLMAQVYLTPVGGGELQVQLARMFSAAGDSFPKQAAPVDQGGTWTFRPAPLTVEAATTGLRRVR